MASRYHDVYGAWRADPDAFWREAAGEIDFAAIGEAVERMESALHEVAESEERS